MAKTLTVDKCLCCIRLEKGGFIIAWWHLIQFIVGLFVLVVFIFLGSICDEGKNNKNANETVCDSNRTIINDEDIFCATKETAKDESDEELSCTAVIVVCAILLVLCLVGVFISWLCIKGIETRQHSYVKPMVIFLGILTVLTIPSIIWLSVVTLVTMAVSGYSFLIMYSLYSLYLSEHERGSVQYGHV